MKLTVEKAIAAKQGITELAGTKLPAKTDYCVGRWDDKLSSIENSFKKTQNKLIIETYGEKVMDDEGKETGRFQVPNEKMEEFQKEVSELLTSEEEISFDALKLSMFDGVMVPSGFFKKMGEIIIE